MPLGPRRTTSPLAHLGRSIAWQTVVGPVQHGRPLPQRWPRPVRVIMLIALVVYALLMASVPLIGLAPLPETVAQTIARVLVTLAMTLILFLLTVASVHMPIGWSLLCGLVIGAALTMTIGAFFSIADRTGEVAPVVMIGLLALELVLAVTLLVLCLSARRRRLAGSWLGLVALLIALAYGVPALALIPLETTESSTAEVIIFLPLMLLLFAATPIAIASGTAYAEILIRASAGVLIALRPLTANVAWPILVVVLVVAHIVRAILVRTEPVRYLTTAAVLVAFLAVCLGCMAWARRRGPVVPPRPADVAEALPRMAYALAPFMILWVPLMRGFGIGPALIVFHVLGAVFALVLTARAVGRGDVVGACLGPAMACGMVSTVLIHLKVRVLNDWAMYPLLAAILVGGLGWWARRGRLLPAHWISTAIGLLFLLGFPYRKVLAEPLGALLGFSAVAVLFFGLVWRVLTDAAYTRVGGRHFPIETRAFLFAAHALTAASAVLATLTALSASVLDLEQLSDSGNTVLGRFAMIAVVAGLLEIGRFSIDPDPDEPVPDHLPDRTRH